MQAHAVCAMLESNLMLLTKGGRTGGSLGQSSHKGITHWAIYNVATLSKYIISDMPNNQFKDNTSLETRPHDWEAAWGILFAWGLKNYQKNLVIGIFL